MAGATKYGVARPERNGFNSYSWSEPMDALSDVDCEDTGVCSLDPRNIHSVFIG